MSELAEPIAWIKTFCLQTAQAVVAAQNILDEKMAAAVSSGEQPQTIEPLYSIPHTNMTLQFGLQIIGGKRSLIPFFSSKSATRVHHGHTLTFSLVAVPERPNPPVSAENIQIQGFQPAFLVSKQVQDDIARLVAQALKNEEWEFAFPAHGVPPDEDEIQDLINDEADKIIDDITPDNPERGNVVLSLDAVTPAYLLIRVTDKSERDGIFVYESNRRVTIYSFEKDKLDNIRYAALHQFILTLRRWLAGGAQPVATGNPLKIAEDPSELGLIALREFATNVYEGYVETLKFLSEERDDEQVHEGLPSFYDVEDIRGELSYSVFYDEAAKRLRFSFGPRMRPDGESVSDEISVVESKAFVHVFRQNDIPQVETRLMAPEFALTDKARQIVIEALIDAADDIAKKFEDLDRETYVKFIKDETFQSEVVILLSYEGKVPKPNFLVAWPGVFQNKARDFVFTCKMKNNKIEGIERIMGLAQDIGLDPIGGTEGVEIDNDQYEAFHNAFHAVRIWRSRVEMSDDDQ